MVVRWEENPDGGYGEAKTTVNKHKITIYSNRDSTRWYYILDSDDAIGPFSSRETAQQEAILDARQA